MNLARDMPASKSAIILLTSQVAGLNKSNLLEWKVCGVPECACNLCFALHKVNFLKDLLLAVLAEVFLALFLIAHFGGS